MTAQNTTLRLCHQCNHSNLWRFEWQNAWKNAWMEEEEKEFYLYDGIVKKWSFISWFSLSKWSISISIPITIGQFESSDWRKMFDFDQTEKRCLPLLDHTFRCKRKINSKELNWDILLHRPYSFDIVPSNYHLLRSLWNNLNENRKNEDRKFIFFHDLQNYVFFKFRRKATFYNKGILTKRWQKNTSRHYLIECINRF